MQWILLTPLPLPKLVNARHLLQIIHFASLSGVYRRQVTSNHIVLPVLNHAAPLLHLLTVVHILDVEARIVLEVAEGEFGEAAGEGLVFL